MNRWSNRNGVIFPALASLFVVAIMVSCAHESYRILVTNDTANGAIVRLSAGPGTSDDVYVVPSGSSGVTRQGIAPFSTTVELLDADCQVLDSISISASGDILVTFSDGAPSAETTVAPASPPAMSRSDRCIRQ